MATWKQLTMKTDEELTELLDRGQLDASSEGDAYAILSCRVTGIVLDKALKTGIAPREAAVSWGAVRRSHL